MNQPLKLMCIFAHPDDESLGVGGTLARYAAEGVETHLLTATRGERGWFGDEASNPGLTALGKMREAELGAAARVLGISSVTLMDYIDGELDQAPADKIVGEIVMHIRRIRPQVVITFGPDGGYGHPDHIAISQFTSAALVLSAASECDPTSFPAHTVSKLYHTAFTARQFKLHEQIFGDLIMHVDGAERRAVPYPDWMITTRVMTEDYWQTAREAVACHRTQLPGYDALLSLPDERLRALWDHNGFSRAFSTVNGGRKLETDLFEGLRGDAI
jgi:LmbE family N-acetylglucosaminyl deacetylase